MPMRGAEAAAQAATAAVSAGSAAGGSLEHDAPSQRSPYVRMPSMIGMSARPFSVSAYSTRGGTAGNVARSTMPSSSRARRRSDSVRGLMPVSERSSSQKREQPSASSRTRSSVHLPQTMSAVRQTGQLSSTGMPLTLPSEVAMTADAPGRRSRVARAGMPVTGPRREHEQQPRVLGGAHLVALAGIEDREEPGTAGDALVGSAEHLDGAVDDDEVGALVDLVVAQQLAGRQAQRNRAGLPARGVEDDRAVRSDVEAAQVPVLVHVADATRRPATGGLPRRTGHPSSCRACRRPRRAA